MMNGQTIRTIRTGDENEIKLTHFTTGGGCACKLRPQALEQVLIDIPILSNDNVLVGPENHDDAAVYQLDENTALVKTVDFFTPIVDDPYWFGAIAAANALSDIYAMGAEALFALNIVGFPSKKLPMSILKEILLGAQEKCEEAGIPILGGHTIDDEDPKYGLVVTGRIRPERILSNEGARPGDVLILTKPLGTGIITSGIKRGLVEPELERRVVRQMATLNKKASETMMHFPVDSVTDVTGFGLLGHLSEMTRGSHVRAEVYFEQVPFLPGIEKMARNKVIPAGTRNNLDYTSPWAHYSENITELQRLMLNDAQTSGGLLIAIPEKESEALQQALETEGVDNWIIGKITGPGKGEIFVK